MYNLSCRGAIDNALTSHGNGLEFDSRRRNFFILTFWSFCFCFVLFFSKFSYFERLKLYR